MEPGASLSVAMRIFHSWLSLKTWVKIWLFWLNGILLAAFAFLHDPLAWYTLASLPLTFLLLLWMAVRYRGLVRILGLGHLVPWVPLLVYLELRLISDLAGPQIAFISDPWLFGWAVALGVSLAVCLAFDAYDVIRWFRGQRFVLGTEDAFNAGASSRSPVLAGD